MDVDLNGNIGYGFVVKGRRALEKLDGPLANDPAFDNIEMMFHGDSAYGPTTIVVINESLKEARGWSKPTVFSLTGLSKTFRANRKEWDKTLAKVADKLGVSFEKGRWYLICQYS